MDAVILRELAFDLTNLFTSYFKILGPTSSKVDQIFSPIPKRILKTPLWRQG
jgi:hypothetical protein